VSRKTRRGRSKAAQSDSKQQHEQRLTEEHEVKLELEELEQQQEEHHVQEEEEDKEKEQRQDESSSRRKRRDGWEKYRWMCTDCSQVISLQYPMNHKIMNIIFIIAVNAP
jgi:hypothetical protein